MQPAGGADSMGQPEPSDASPAPKTVAPPPHARLAGTFAAAGRRVRRAPRPRRPPVWSRDMTAAAIAGLVLVAVAALADGAATEFARHSRLPIVVWMAEWTDVGESQWYLVPAAVVFIGAGLADWARAGFSRRARLSLVLAQAGFAFASVALSGIFVNVVKFFIGRARPILFEKFGPYHFDPFSVGYSFVSFPSGHATTMGAVSAVLMIWFPRLRWPILALGVFFAATRVAARAHYPSDVAAGFVIGLLLTIALARYLAARQVAFRFDGDRMLPVVPTKVRGK